ncbi:interleukin-17C [Mixophyes fleayi]|uniref:interleukin-17C n=1 Tax=Mixophyes fleayi TaxID=3061075 RepID=UPI003F4DE360
MDFRAMCVLILLAVFSSNICNARHHPKHHLKHHHDVTFCFSDEELKKTPSSVLDNFVGHRMRWEQYTAWNLVSHLEDIKNRRKRSKRASETTCPNYNLLQTGERVEERSISPWAYRIDVDDTRYPQKLAFAHCLCQHCISSDTGRENSSLNSVLIKQEMLVLRKKSCPHNPALSTFVLEKLSVPVGCTCSIPRY